MIHSRILRIREILSKIIDESYSNKNMSDKLSLIVHYARIIDDLLEYEEKEVKNGKT